MGIGLNKLLGSLKKKKAKQLCRALIWVFEGADLALPQFGLRFGLSFQFWLPGWVY